MLLIFKCATECKIICTHKNFEFSGNIVIHGIYSHLFIFLLVHKYIYIYSIEYISIINFIIEYVWGNMSGKVQFNKVSVSSLQNIN